MQCLSPKVCVPLCTMSSPLSEPYGSSLDSHAVKPGPYESLGTAGMGGTAQIPMRHNRMKQLNAELT